MQSRLGRERSLLADLIFVFVLRTPITMKPNHGGHGCKVHRSYREARLGGVLRALWAFSALMAAGAAMIPLWADPLWQLSQIAGSLGPWAVRVACHSHGISILINDN